MKISIRARLTIWFGAVFFCGVTALGFSSYLTVRASCLRVLDNELSIRADGVEGFLNEHIARLPLPRVQHEISVHGALKPAFLVVQSSQGPGGDEIYCGSEMANLCAGVIQTQAGSFTTGQQLRILAVTRIVHGAQYRILVANDLSFQTAILRHFSYWLLIVAPVALVSSALGGYWLSGRALRPVTEIINEVQAIEEHSLGKRIGVPITGDEIQILSETLNGMLDRMEGAFRQVKEITANASHELRTPISVIRTSAEIALLNATPTVESHRIALLQICAEAEKNTRLLEGMMMLARVESGAQPLHFARLSLAKSVKQSLESCRRLAEEKNIHLSCQENRTDLYVWADASHLNRLWLALLDNAIKYSNTGGQVVARIVLNDQDEPVCEISDNGIGIDPIELPHIFERFYRAENAKFTTNTGHGLGLAIAGKIAEMHHASISAKSVDRSGSIFRVTFAAPVTASMAQPSRISKASLSPISTR